MGTAVKRGYRSDLRAGQAVRTRRAVVAAASRLFIEQGYGATTMDAVADAAGVSRKTVFTAVGGKAELLKIALDWAVAGDETPMSLADRAVTRRVLAHTGAAALLADWASMLAAIDVRTAALFVVLESAAGIDADARRLLDESQDGRRAGAADVIARLIELRELRPGLTRDEAIDIAWLAGDPILFDRLVRQRDWPVGRFTGWLTVMLTGQLLA